MTVPFRRSFAALLLLCCSVGISKAQDLEQQYISLAKQFVTAFEEKNFSECLKFADESIKDKLTIETLQKTHDQLHSKLGKLVKMQGELFEDNNAYKLVYIGCQFELKTLDYKIVFTPAKKLVGFFLVAPVPKEQYKVPPYAKRDSLIEIPVVISTIDTFKLPGVMTVPLNPARPPIVIMVQGSGPQDRDETIHGNKPFKDLALGLAAHGIATLRYDKRTLIYGQSSAIDANKITPKEEVVDDALGAIRFMRFQMDLDTTRIFILGHSLGGMLAPKIAEEDKHLAGLIMMAAPGRTFEDNLIDQMEFLLPQQMDPLLADSQLVTARKTIVKIKNHLYTNETPFTQLFGLPPTYWDYLSKYDQVKTAKSLTLPMLIMQGGRDYQSTAKDFHLWKTMLALNDNVSFEFFPDLYHLFMPGIGTYTDYDVTANIPASVIDRIAWWINTR